MPDIFFIDGRSKPLPQWLEEAIANGTVVVHGDSFSNSVFFNVGNEIATIGQQLVFDGHKITVN